MKRQSFHSTSNYHWPAAIFVLFILILGLCECANPQAYDDIKVGWENQRHLYHAIQADRIFGDVSDTTIGDASAFADNHLQWMLGYLSNAYLPVLATGSDRNTIIAQSPTIKPLTIQGAADQTADLLEFLDDSGSRLSRFDAQGRLHTPAAYIDTLFGNIVHATEINIDVNGFKLYSDGTYSVIESERDLLLKPIAGAKIIPATMMEFPDGLGDKIRFFSHSYSIGVSPFTLDITSDMNIKFHSDTVPDLMVIWGDEGDVDIKQDLYTGRDILAGRCLGFYPDCEGDKLLLFGTLYRLAISANDVDYYSDRYHKWHSDTNEDAMVLDANTGDLNVEGAIQASGGFNVSGTAGISGTISPASAIVVQGGLITGTTSSSSGWGPYLGEIRLFAFSAAPNGWAKCDGQLLNIAEYPDLYALLGTLYGGDGTTTFGLPDYRGRVPIHQGAGNGLTARTMGAIGGAEIVSITIDTMPSHSHSIIQPATTTIGSSVYPTGGIMSKPADNRGMYETDPSDTVNMAPFNSESSGGGLPHNNMPPFAVGNYCICVIGQVIE